MKIHKFIRIQASKATVFDCITDAAKIPLWMDEVETIHYLSEIDPLNPIGTRFRQRLREGPMTRNYDGRVEVYEEYDRFSVTFSDRRFRFRLDYYLEDFEGGTKLRYKLVNEKESLLTLLAGGLVAGMTESMVVRHLRNLKAYAETHFD